MLMSENKPYRGAVGCGEVAIVAEYTALKLMVVFPGFALATLENNKFQSNINNGKCMVEL